MRTSPCHRVVLVLATILTAAPAVAFAAPEIDVQAYVGRPFGVGQMTVRFDQSPALPPDAPLWLSEKQGRALYPAMERRGMRVPTSSNATGPTAYTVYFLFRGEQPLTLTVKTDQEHTATARPEKSDSAHDKLLKTWWRRYTAMARNVATSGAYQPLIENYLMAMLGRRLGLEAPKLPLAFSRWQAADQALAIMTGAESVRVAAQTDVLLEKDEVFQPADQPMPTPVRSPPIRLPESKDGVEIESIAHHVPVECFYIRCGSFANFSWLRSTIDRWGGKIRHLASVRGLDYDLSRRIERQLALRETALAKLLGDTVISDVAIIGTDTFLREGASVGVLFEARSDAALRLQILQQRQEVLAADSKAQETTLQIHDRKVSLLSTPDNTVRSFWVADGKYHLVTTSRTLAKRFIEAGEGKDSLGGADEYRWARNVMPLADNHTAFVYLSDPFFRQLVGPQYRIEMTRRTRAAAEGDLVRLAKLAAEAEGTPTASIDELVDRGFLPEKFGTRPDGSQVVVDGDRMFDSLRGGYGSFVPVPDVPITGVTNAESMAYKEFAQMYQRLWRRMDPTIIGLKRKVLQDGKTERLVFDLHITPYAREHYEALNMFMRTADKKRWAAVPGDIASIDANVLGYKYALGVRDFVPHFAISRGRVHYSGPRDEEGPIYMAANGPEKQGRGSFYLFDSSYVENKKTADESGDMRVQAILSGQAWLRRLTAVDLVAYNKQVLDQVAPYAEFVPAERTAKAKLRIGDLAGTGLAAAINAEGYTRARRVSGGNVLLLHSLMQQLHVPGDQAKQVAEQLLHGRLVCPLGGEYKMEGGFTGVDRWQSTAWHRPSLHQESYVPKGFRTPLLNWFAGVALEFNIDATALSTHIELDVRPGKD